LISNVFQNYIQWWENTTIPKPAILSNGLFTGDCSASYEIGDLKIGIVGLNSAYLQLASGNFKNKLHLDVSSVFMRPAMVMVWTGQNNTTYACCSPTIRKRG